MKLTDIRDFLIARQQAYREVFNPENVFSRKVIKDLSQFCRAETSTFHPDPRVHAVLEGRREVFLRIKKHLGYDTEKFLETYGINKEE